MTSRKPYLLRAMVEWAEDNAWTPLLAVNATVPGVRVPSAYVENGQITLNVGFSALNQRHLGNELVSGYARFGGKSEYLEVPMEAVTALVVRETGEGMVFPEEPATGLAEADETLPEPAAGPNLQAVDSASEREESSDDEPEPPPRGRPHLKVVK